MKKNLTAVAFSVFLSLLLPLPSWAETVLEEIKRTGGLFVSETGESIVCDSV